jgi:hypothetical protein
MVLDDLDGVSSGSSGFKDIDTAGFHGGTSLLCVTTCVLHIALFT